MRGISDEVVELLWAKYNIALRTENYYSRVPEVYDVLTMIQPVWFTTALVKRFTYC